MSAKNTASTEERVGTLHSLVTEAFIKKTSHMLDEVENGESPDFAISTMDLGAAARWVQANGITAVGADEQKTSTLSAQLEEIKARQRGKTLRAVGED